MTTLQFNAWAARFMAALEKGAADRAAASILNDQRTACATTCRIEIEGAAISG